MGSDEVEADGIDKKRRKGSRTCSPFIILFFLLGFYCISFSVRFIVAECDAPKSDEVGELGTAEV